MLFRSKRRVFAITLISFVWLMCGSINCVVLGFRTTPFSAIDVLMATSAIRIIDKYLSPIQITLVIIGVILLSITLVYLFLKLPQNRENRSFVKAFGLLIIFIFTSTSLTNMAVTAHTLSDDFENLGYAYENYGFAYCFFNSIVDVGIEQPKNYSEQTINEITSKLDTSYLSTEQVIKTEATNEKPNVIMIQLESFIDPNIIKSITYNEDPVPTFSYLKDNFTTGKLTVPSIGAGTANTEFEVLTGLSTDYFGAGEYPYKTVLTKQTCGKRRGGNFPGGFKLRLLPKEPALLFQEGGDLPVQLCQL